MGDAVVRLAAADGSVIRAEVHANLEFVRGGRGIEREMTLSFPKPMQSCNGKEEDCRRTIAQERIHVAFMVMRGRRGVGGVQRMTKSGGAEAGADVFG